MQSPYKHRYTRTDKAQSQKPIDNKENPQSNIIAPLDKAKPKKNKPANAPQKRTRTINRKKYQYSALVALPLNEAYFSCIHTLTASPNPIVEEMD